MDCPICFEVINAQTGIVTTSCSHSFHFACIAGWYLKQEKGTCPCCRKEMGPTEDFPNADEQGGEDSDEDSDYEGEEEIEFSRAELDVFLRARGGIGLTDAMAEAICQEAAAFTCNELNALLVGNGARIMTEEAWNELISEQEDDDEDEEEDEDFVFDAANYVSHHHFMWQSDEGGAFHRILKNAEHVKKATVKIQALWRGYSSRSSTV